MSSVRFTDDRALEPELMIGLVAAVGTPLDLIQRLFHEGFRENGYETEVLHLSQYAGRFVLGTGTPRAGPSEVERIEAMMSQGNEAREVTGRNDVLALAAIADLRVRRGDENRPMPRRVFVLRQLERPEEVALLRRTYGTGFLLIGIYCPRSSRERHLRERGATAEEIERLIVRDEREPSASGQQLRDTFHLADVFIEVHEEPSRTAAGIGRLLRLLFGSEIVTPTREEFGMFHAHAASLRSAQLGRQVGAAILSPRGDVIALGTNEVPRFHGGAYWDGDSQDARDHVRGRDSSDEARERIVREILEQLESGWNELDEPDREAQLRASLDRLRGTRIASLTEFGRAVHAEADALLSAARMGTSPLGGTLYCTTFPCHVCAKHIVGAGIHEVVYIEPYPKSRALELHDDSIAIEESANERVLFRPFVGVAPRRFSDLFSIVADDGSEIHRKDDEGHVITGHRNLRLRMGYFSGPQREALAARALESITTRRA